MTKLLERIPSKSDKELMSLLHNALKHQDKKLTTQVISEIYKVWRSRAVLAQLGEYKTDLDADGVLSAFGYHVGNFGITDAGQRQKLLALIFEADLPPVLSPEYILEWGQPSSKQRLRKLSRVLRGLVSSKSKQVPNKKSLKRAVDHWKDDLSFLAQRFSHTLNAF